VAEKLSPEQDAALRAAFDAGSSGREAARRAGVSVSIALMRYKRWRGGSEPAPKAEPTPNLSSEPKVEVGGDGRSQTMTGLSPRMIYSEEEAVAFFKVDLTRWRVTRWKAGMWQIGMKMKGAKDEPDKAEMHALCKVMIEMEPVAPKGVLDGLDLVFKRFESESFRLPAPKLMPCLDGRMMMEVSIPDLHLGKLCWAPETGQDYDLKIAERVYNQSLANLIYKARGFDLDMVVLLLGSDFFHYDTPHGTTTGGTPLDRDGRFPKMFDIGVRCKIAAVATLLKLCSKVHVKHVGGNHDRNSSYCLARVVAERYHNDDRVTVDCEPNVRKYLRYGANLIGYTHGDEVKLDKLPLIMATERKEDWAATTCREWHLGHFHTSRTFQTKPVDEHMGVEVIVVPALCGADAWHHEKGFVGNARAANAFIYDKDDGKIATLRTIARP
jgi:hypothetical protein